METVEEDRVFSLLRATALELEMPLFEWSVTQGLVRVPGVSSMYGTSDPLNLLSTLEGMDTQSIYYLKDFAKFTTDPTLARKLREVSQRFSKKRSTLVLTGKTVELPGEIEQAVIAARYRGLYQKQPLDTGLLLEEISETIPLSVFRREDIQRLRDIARACFVNVA